VQPRSTGIRYGHNGQDDGIAPNRGDLH
jgi:hypothetical protein